MSGSPVTECIRIITSADPEVRNRSLESVCGDASVPALLRECEALDRFRRGSANLYEKVRALFFLYAIHRFHLPGKLERAAHVPIPYTGHVSLLNRRFEEAIEVFLDAQKGAGPAPSLSSALAAAYKALGFQTLADQVRQQRTFPSRQSVDVPHGAPRRSSAATAPGASEAGRRTDCFRSCGNALRCAWI